MFNKAKILGRKIFVLTAHPDDESFLASGTLYQNNESGGETYLVCATLGEKGKSHLTRPISEEALKRIRHKELKNACKFMQIQTVKDLDLPDGQVNKFEDDLYKKALVHLTSFQPEAIMSFGSDGITGHKDHIAVSRVAKRLAESQNLTLISFCIPREIKEDAYEWLIKKRRTLGNYEDSFELQDSNLEIAIEADIKLKCVKCYESQIDNSDPFADFPEHIAKKLLKKECFYVQNYE